ncbi:helix-turn-helix domain-containing protein [Stutzerimonas stutzeri]
MKMNEHALARVVGKAISKRRVVCMLTQEEVAERLNIGNEAVSRMERGIVMPTVARLVELAGIFDCPVGDLLIESSNRAEDQGRAITNLIGTLSNKDRAFVLEMVASLSAHLAKP